VVGVSFAVSVVGVEGDVGLGDLHLREVILHLDLLLHTGIFHGKEHILRHQIPGRGGFLPERILPDRQLLHIMRLFPGSSGFHNLSGFIDDTQLRAGDLISGCDIGFGNADLRHIILHLHLLDFTGIFHLKGYGFRGRIAVRRYGLDQLVLAADHQLLNDMRLFLRYPFIDQAGIPVDHPQVRSRQLLPGSDICL